MEYTKKFSQLNKESSSIAGGKGASLGEMLNARIPVPDGYVVLSTTFDEFIKKAGLYEEIDGVLDAVDHTVVHTIDAASEKIQELIKHAAMPEDIAAEIFAQFDVLDAQYVAVRSSATAEDGADHAWAGQLDSYLNTTRDNVLKKVQDCWASLFTPRAIFYRFEKGLHTTAISVAVVVQKMVNSEISGIAFSVHPVTEDRNQLIIEAGFGLGEAIVSGSVTPDSYVVEKNPRRIIDITVNHQNKALYRKEGGGNEWTELADQKADAQILTEDHINELSNIILTIENHYGFPCDIEWAYEGGKFYIVQSRPITTLSAPATHPDFPANHYFTIPLVKMGQWALASLDSDIWFSPITSKYFESLFGFPKGILHISSFDSGYTIPYIPADYFKKLYNYIDTINKDDYKGLSKKLETFYTFQKQAREAVPAIIAKDLATVSNDELIQYYTTNRDWIHHSASYDQFGWIGELYWAPHMDDILTKKVGIAKDSEEYHRVLFALTKPEHISTTLEEKRSVLKEAIAIAKGERTVEDAVRDLTTRFGWMPVFAYGTPWDASHYTHDLTEASKRPIAELEAEYAPIEQYTQIQQKDFNDIVTQYNIEPRDAQIFVDFGMALDARNEAEYIVSFCGFHLLPLYIEISKRLGVSIDELRKLFEFEVVECLQGKADIHALIQKKGSTVASGYSPDMTERIIYGPDESKALLEHAEKVATVQGQTEGEKGVCASPGKVTGKIRIVPNPKDQDKVEVGDILVTYATTVDYLPSMKKAGAIVTEVGGLTCHAAVVSREFGIPCVVSLKNAMTIFTDGEEVEVDAGKGIVRSLAKKAEAEEKEFEKEYTRDTTLLIQQSWYDVVAYAFEKKCDIKNPHLPPVVHYMNDGVIEIWENKLATPWFLDTLQSQIAKDPNFISSILDQYEKDLIGIKKYWAAGTITDKTVFTEYVNHVFAVMHGFIFMYYAGMDERTPAETRERALHIRENDTYFDSNDKLMRQSLIAMYPELKGVEASILRNEVANPPERKVLEERKKNFVMLGEIEGTIATLTEYQSQHSGLHFNIEMPEMNAAVLQGQIGNKGFAKGIVRILKRKEQIEDTQEGEIIVSAMTTPEFMPAMQKAAAFVTDEGGITCHAAIVARELGKPCIIGTKFATQILKDGDMVEVDADNGIVRIIS